MPTGGTQVWAFQLPVIIPRVRSNYLVVRGGGGFSLPLSDAEHGAEFKTPGLKVQLGERGEVGFLLAEDIFILPAKKRVPR